ncbi:unnamed protein product [Camellia sinensis]
MLSNTNYVRTSEYQVPSAKVTMQPTASEGETAPAAATGLGAGASAARDPSMRETIVTTTAIIAISETLLCEYQQQHDGGHAWADQFVHEKLSHGPDGWANEFAAEHERDEEVRSVARFLPARMESELAILGRFLRSRYCQHRLIKCSNVVVRFFVALHARIEVNVELKKEADFFGVMKKERRRLIAEFFNSEERKMKLQRSQE